MIKKDKLKVIVFCIVLSVWRKGQFYLFRLRFDKSLYLNDSFSAESDFET